MSLGTRLKTLLDEKQISVKKLSEDVGASPSTIYSIIQRDNKKADVDLLFRIAKRLDVSADFLLSDDVIEVAPETEALEEIAQHIMPYVRKLQNLAPEQQQAVLNLIDLMAQTQERRG